MAKITHTLLLKRRYKGSRLLTGAWDVNFQHYFTF